MLTYEPATKCRKVRLQHLRSQDRQVVTCLAMSLLLRARPEDGIKPMHITSNQPTLMHPGRLMRCGTHYESPLIVISAPASGAFFLILMSELWRLGLQQPVTDQDPSRNNEVVLILSFQMSTFFFSPCLGKDHGCDDYARLDLQIVVLDRRFTTYEVASSQPMSHSKVRSLSFSVHPQA